MEERERTCFVIYTFYIVIEGKSRKVNSLSYMYTHTHTNQHSRAVYFVLPPEKWVRFFSFIPSSRCVYIYLQG